jgi:hypothetical protein
MSTRGTASTSCGWPTWLGIDRVHAKYRCQFFSNLEVSVHVVWVGRRAGAEPRRSAARTGSPPRPTSRNTSRRFSSASLTLSTATAVAPQSPPKSRGD